jgi:hypothetical protein
LSCVSLTGSSEFAQSMYTPSPRYCVRHLSYLRTEFHFSQMNLFEVANITLLE